MVISGTGTALGLLKTNKECRFSGPIPEPGNLNFNKITRWFVGILNFEKWWSGFVVRALGMRIIKTVDLKVFFSFISSNNGMNLKF